MTQPGGSVTKPQRRALRALVLHGPQRPFDLQQRAGTSPSGLSVVTSRLYPLVKWSPDAEVYYIPAEERERAQELSFG